MKVNIKMMIKSYLSDGKKKKKTIFVIVVRNWNLLLS